MSVKLLKRQLKPNHIYRRSDLERLSGSIDRDLYTLVNEGFLRKESAGLYYRPKKSKFGPVPPSHHSLVAAFLKTEDFLMFSYTDFNSLGLGLTQQYNRYVIYNNKRHEEKKMAGVIFVFRRRVNFPKKVTPEFLFIEYLNQEKHLAEKTRLSREALLAQMKHYRSKILKNIARDFGKVHTKKLVANYFRAA